MAAAFTENDNLLSHLGRQMSIYSPETNDELWRECAAWFTRWGILRNDHKANWPTAGIADLANILRDGVLLCKLLNKIDPGCIDMKDVSLKPTLAQFLCLRNIGIFLKACVDHFGLKQSDLFEDTMLFDLTNFHKVLCTLSKLSLSSKVLKSRIPGFTAQRMKREEEMIYQSLKSVQLPVKARGLVDQGCAFDVTEEEIYQDLFPACTSVEQPPTVEKRDFVIKELLDTEKNYVDVLTKLKKNFMKPLLSVMNIENHNTVFFKIKELKDIHSDFLKELLGVRTNPSVKLSNIFMRWREKFLVYGMYCANLSKATSVLQELCDNDEIFNQTIIKYEKEDNNGRFKLRDVLSVPMQRILKYHLLLDKLIENTDPNHEELNELKRAREAMLDVAGYINEAARDSDDLEVINNLQETITEWNLSSNQRLSDYGRLVIDASLKIKAHDDQKTRSRYVFIFDKCILICKELKGSQFAFRNLINIAEYHVEEIHNRPLLNREARTSYLFYLVKNDNQTVYTILVRTIELKQQIIKAINDALDNLHPKAMQRTSHSFELQTFAQPVQCLHCSKYLKGLINQGYKCNTCGISVHKSCLQNSGRCGHTSSQVSSPVTNGSSDCPLKDKLWFVGEMERNLASTKLLYRENGTFMVRLRRQGDDTDKFALSLKTEDTVTHMKICCNHEVPGNTKKYFLSHSKFFNSIEELVLNYQIDSLKENFERLDENTRLLWPFRQLKAVTIRKFDAWEACQTSIREDEYVIVIGKEGYKEGWWKIRKVNNETGYVPLSSLRVEGEMRFEYSGYIVKI
ncbi:vav guanine nucleotide exchange factor isoform X2 [Leptinotarsa decemlineata]